MSTDPMQDLRQREGCGNSPRFQWLLGDRIRKIMTLSRKQVILHLCFNITMKVQMIVSD